MDDSLKYIGYGCPLVDSPDLLACFPEFLEDHISDKPVPHKKEIVSYLRGCNLGATCAGWMTDGLTGEQVVEIRDNDRHDDKYSWGESLAYYVDRYNLMLPDDFLQHIYRKLKLQDEVPHSQEQPIDQARAQAEAEIELTLYGD